MSLIRQISLRIQLNRLAIKPFIYHKSVRMSAFTTTAQAANNKQSDSPPAPPAQSTRSRPTQGELVEHVMSQPEFPRYDLIDIAINLTDRSFEKDLDQVLDRSSRAGVKSLIISGCCLRSTQAAQKLTTTDTNKLNTSSSLENGLNSKNPSAQPPPPPSSSSSSTSSPSSPSLFYTSGVHPHNARHCDENTISTLRQLALHPKCVAIGECGLDFNRNFSPPEIQRKWLIKQIELAEELGKPLFMHCRDAGPDFFDILR
jgi:TatD DNase family protein